MRAMHRAEDRGIAQHQAHHSKPVLPRTIYAVTALMSNGNCQKYVLARLNEVFVVCLLRALVKALLQIPQGLRSKLLDPRVEILAVNAPAKCFGASSLPSTKAW